MTKPETCNGLLIPIVACDQIYTFTTKEFLDELTRQADPALKSGQISADAFATFARDMFVRIITSFENIGGLDEHRALNYLLVQHPAPFVAAVQRHEAAVLDSIQTRTIARPSGRRVVDVVFTFIDRATSVPERLFARVDVTEEWPFLADTSTSVATPLGLLPYIGDDALKMSV